MGERSRKAKKFLPTDLCHSQKSKHEHKTFIDSFPAIASTHAIRQITNNIHGDASPVVYACIWCTHAIPWDALFNNLTPTLNTSTFGWRPLHLTLSVDSCFAKQYICMPNDTMIPSWSMCQLLCPGTVAGQARRAIGYVCVGAPYITWYIHWFM